MPRLHVCSTPGCPELTTARRCPDCASAYEQRRGTRQARGYDAAYDRARARWKPKVEAGEVDCHALTCLEPIRRILPTALWDLGHDDNDRSIIRGPEHRKCNRSAGGRASHAQ